MAIIPSTNDDDDHDYEDDYGEAMSSCAASASSIGNYYSQQSKNLIFIINSQISDFHSTILYRIQ